MHLLVEVEFPFHQLHLDSSIHGSNEVQVVGMSHVAPGADDEIFGLFVEVDVPCRQLHLDFWIHRSNEVQVVEMSRVVLVDGDEIFVVSVLDRCGRHVETV